MLVPVETLDSMIFPFLFVLFLAVANLSIKSGEATRFDYVCGFDRIKRVFVRFGDSGLFAAYNLTLSGLNKNTTEKCQIEIVTCPSCIVSFYFKHLIFSCFCGNELDIAYSNVCRGEYVQISEPPYTDAFATSMCKISSEFNPAIPPYPRDLIAEYVVSCLSETLYDSSGTISTDFDCRILLIFTDFQLASASVVEFYDGIQRLDIIRGSSFRPPVIVTASNFLTLRFFAFGDNNLGFKASFSFVSGSIAKKMTKLSTDCGGFVENLGGTITMMNMVGSEKKIYDCIWLIRPLNNLLKFKNHLYLKITSFQDLAGEAELQIRQGLTSESPLIEALHYPVPQNFKEHVFSSESGYYVSLRATFGPASHVAIAYASFSYNQCFVFSDFFCQNHRCISKKLNCDGFDHCGDSSDESVFCYRGWNAKPGHGQWYVHAPNYYFPKVKAFSDFQTASFIFLLTLIGLIVLASALTILLYRAGKRVSRQETFQNQLESFSEIRDALSDEIYVEDVGTDDPPGYEFPPSYEDIVATPGSSQPRNSKFSSVEKRSAIPEFDTTSSTLVSGFGTSNMCNNIHLNSFFVDRACDRNTFKESKTSFVLRGFLGVEPNLNAKASDSALHGSNEYSSYIEQPL